MSCTERPDRKRKASLDTIPITNNNQDATKVVLDDDWDWSNIYRLGLSPNCLTALQERMDHSLHMLARLDHIMPSDDYSGS